MINIEFRDLTKIEEFRVLSQEEIDFRAMFTEALREVNFYDWCQEVTESYVGIYEAEIVGVFLFRINPIAEYVDEFVWVIVGDIPTIYITPEESPNAACALDSYIGAMRKWVRAAENGESILNLVPVNVDANLENAKMLKSRLDILHYFLQSNYEEELEISE